MKTILLTGACSAIGGAIYKSLLAEDYCVLDMCRCDGTDLLNPASIARRLEHQIDGVVHVAECGLLGLRNLMAALEGKFNPNYSIVLLSSVHHLNHDDEYARSKREQEAWLKGYALTNNARANILRLGHITGTRAWPIEDQSRLPEIPLQRFGKPEDVAQAVMFLLEAEWLCGSVMTLDGGMSLKV